jgi:hypothetical protein
LPRYNTVRSDKYIALGWRGLYNQGVITNEADPTAYANTNLFFEKGGNQYNSWNVANGSELIDPVTRQVREGVTKYTLREKRCCFQASVRSETNLTMGGEKENKLFHFIWLFERSRVQLIQILNVYLHVLVLTMKLKA